jgi:hypothetical protein
MFVVDYIAQKNVVVKMVGVPIKNRMKKVDTAMKVADEGIGWFHGATDSVLL